MANVSIFVPHNGCPNKCSFCEQRHITGFRNQPTSDDVKSTVEIALNSLQDRAKSAEIAFFGGSFTAIERNYMIELLKSTQEYIEFFKGIRISTRPDAIDNEVLDILKEYNVTSIELGAQSMSDEVLLANDRGHSAEDVTKSSKLIKEYGFSLGLQMMTGLYKSTSETDLYTAEKFISLKPDTVRIYPTVVLKNTTLCDLYENSIYVPPAVEESVILCSKLIQMFESAGIKVIRVGLHASDTISENMVAGAYHPAFRELCESRIYFDKIISILKESDLDKGKISVYVPSSDLSKAIGQKGINRNAIKELGYIPAFLEDNTLHNRQVVIKKG